MKKIHFIAIGGSAMHSLAVDLKKNGYDISGSDDEIFNPARSVLEKHGLLPLEEGWDESKITLDIDAIVVGMHAKNDNPELQKAMKLGLKIFSYPEFLFEHAKDKKRVVIGGSHGKTTVTSMIMHVLNKTGKKFDYMVGAQIDGFDNPVRLSDDAPVMIFEGDEYLTSPTDTRPKFHLYKPHIAVLTGIAWDHINVFPTFEIYVDQFRRFINLIEPEGTLIFCSEDEELVKLYKNEKRSDINYIPYEEFKHERNIEGENFIIIDKDKYPIDIFGHHNFLNLSAAFMVCTNIGVNSRDFCNAIKDFHGASNRLQKTAECDGSIAFKDFAHSPSKLKATINAVKEQYPDKKIVACMELHTYSSLSESFLTEYKNSMDKADVAIVYFNPHALKIKRLPEISIENVFKGFKRDDIEIFTESEKLSTRLKSENYKNSVLLLMSSGNFDGIDIIKFSNELICNQINY